MHWMWQITPAEEAAEAQREAEQAARAAEEAARAPAEEAAVTWPADLPRPSEGRRFPSARVLAKWIGVPPRRFGPHELAAMVTAWADAARAAGLSVDVEPVRSPFHPRSADRPARSGRDS